MALTDFFRINMPYGIKRNPAGEWFAFNREYMPLGFNSRTAETKSIYDKAFFSDLPIHTKYKGLTEERLIKLARGSDAIKRDENDQIEMVFFYSDGTNPVNGQSNADQLWQEYFDKIKYLSKFQRK